MVVTINLRQARELLSMFGGQDAEISVGYFKQGRHGEGLYAWYADYPDEGSMLLGESIAFIPCAGRCHGLTDFCDHCGDVSGVCDVPDDCDLHRLCGDCGQKERHCVC